MQIATLDSLANPKEAPRIISELKRLPLESQPHASTEGKTVDDEKAGGQSSTGKLPVKPTLAPVRATCLQCTDEEAMRDHQHVVDAGQNGHGSHLNGHSKAEQATSSTPDASTNSDPAPEKAFLGRFTSLSTDGIPTPGSLLASLATSSGALNALASASGQLVESSGAHAQLSNAPPTDRISVLMYWWGYELVLPSKSLKYLANAHSVAGWVKSAQETACAQRLILSMALSEARYLRFCKLLQSAVAHRNLLR